MVYYSAIGDSRGTLLKRYFTSQDPAVKEEALEELRVVDEKFAVEPLLFEPGTGWVYGQSTDWAGKLVWLLPRISPIFIPSPTFSKSNREVIRKGKKRERKYYSFLLTPQPPTHRSSNSPPKPSNPTANTKSSPPSL